MTTARAADVAVVGAGPYGLSVAGHLRAAGVETSVFGRPMSFWREHMPEGMLLRSSPSASSISDPGRRLTLAQYCKTQAVMPQNPLPLDDFLAYADWFRKELDVAVDARRVTRLDMVRGGFELQLDDGDRVEAQKVVVASGIA